MTTGSGIMTNQRARLAHLVKGKGGVAGEVADLRSDIQDEFASSAAIAVEEWTNPLALDTAGVLASVVSQAAPIVYEAASLVGAAAVALDPPRNVTLTCDAGGGATWLGALTVTGIDVNGDAITEDIAFAAGVTTDGVKAFARVDSLSAVAQADALGNWEVGFGTIIGLSKLMKTRAGAGAALAGIEAGTLTSPPGATVVAAGTGEPNGTFDPAAAPDGVRDYALYYEIDPTA